jgi:hypothetical protein
MDPHLFHVDEKAAHDTKPEGKQIKTAPRPFHVDGKPRRKEPEGSSAGKRKPAGVAT